MQTLTNVLHACAKEVHDNFYSAKKSTQGTNLYALEKKEILECSLS